MEKQMTMTANTETVRKASDVIRRIANTVSIPMRMLRRYYSYVLKHEVSNAEARAITEAQLAFFATILPADISIMIRIAACVWFVVAVKKCGLYIRHND